MKEERIKRNGNGQTKWKHKTKRRHEKKSKRIKVKRKIEDESDERKMEKQTSPYTQACLIKTNRIHTTNPMHPIDQQTKKKKLNRNSFYIHRRSTRTPSYIVWLSFWLWICHVVHITVENQFWFLQIYMRFVHFVCLLLLVCFFFSSFHPLFRYFFSFSRLLMIKKKKTCIKNPKARLIKNFEWKIKMHKIIS